MAARARTASTCASGTASRTTVSGARSCWPGATEATGLEQRGADRGGAGEPPFDRGGVPPAATTSRSSPRRIRRPATSTGRRRSSARPSPQPLANEDVYWLPEIHRLIAELGPASGREAHAAHGARPRPRPRQPITRAAGGDQPGPPHRCGRAPSCVTCSRPCRPASARWRRPRPWICSSVRRPSDRSLANARTPSGRTLLERCAGEPAAVTHPTQGEGNNDHRDQTTAAHRRERARGPQGGIPRRGHRPGRSRL